MVTLLASSTFALKLTNAHLQNSKRLLINSPNSFTPSLKFCIKSSNLLILALFSLSSLSSFDGISVISSNIKGKQRSFVAFSNSDSIFVSSSFISSNDLEKFLIDWDANSVILFAFSDNSSYFELYNSISFLAIFKEELVVFFKKDGKV